MEMIIVTLVTRRKRREFIGITSGLRELDFSK